MKKLVLFVAILMIIGLHAAPRSIEIFDNDYQYTRADSAHGFDVLSYDITLYINDATHYIEGQVEAVIEAEENLTEIIYELEQLDVEAVLVNGATADFAYDDHEITIDLGNISTGEEFTTIVQYSGYPTLSNDVYHLGIIFNPSYVFTLSDPSGCRWWWPAYDHPWDKAEVDFHVRIRDDWLVACNGIRTEIVDNGDGTKTHHWDGSNPMTTFLASISAANYVEIEQNYNDLPIHNFVTPGQYNNALTDFNNLPDMIDIYSNRYGVYPFEKYGNSVVPMVTFGAMEHQTMTTLGSYIITGNHQYETTIAHELAHQWFGNCLTPLTWADVWLSEGFAVYSEAVFTEDFYNYEAMLDYVHSSIQNYYLSWSSGQNYTVYDPTFNNYFAPVSYEKAASVLHMLRGRVGSDQFFQILQTYFLQYHNSNVVTEEFKQVCEDVSGEDLEQFFEQWIYGSGIPTYDYTWFVDNESNPPQLKTFAKTSSTSGTDFYLKIPIEVNSNNEIQYYHVDSAPESGFFTEITLEPGDVSNVQFDPDRWILSRGVFEHLPEISNAYSADGQVQVAWLDFWDLIEIDGYNVYRSLDEYDNYEKINETTILGNTYLDESVENGITYYYRVKAVLEDNYESHQSEAVEAMPFGFALDQGILLIDETMDGAGIPGNPNDLQVDQFYNDVISQNYTSYDYDDLGSPELSYLANYSTIIWHDDDISQHLINSNIENLGSYLISGGNLIISGWKTANEVEDYFLDEFLNTEAQMTTGFQFTEALSNTHPNLQLNHDKLSQAFNGTLPFVCVFTNTDAGFYTFHAENGSSHEGETCAVNTMDQANLFFLGFPLFYFENQCSADLLNQIFEELGETGSEEVLIPSDRVSCKTAPNPFNPLTTISFNLPEACTVSLEIYNLKGQKIRTLLNKNFLAGQYQQQWNGKDQNGTEVASGIYYFTLRAGNTVISKKLLMLK